MAVNRLANLMGNSQGQSQQPPAGFTVNPFASSMHAWQLQIYQAAFLQAQKDMEKEAEDFPLAEWWN